jgi:signal transduction histidine kinase
MRRRIFLLTISLSLLIVLAFAIPLAFLVRSSVEQHALNEARDDATNVAAYLRSNYPTDSAISAYLNDINQRSRRKTCVETPAGAVLGQPPPDGVPVDSGAQVDPKHPTAGNHSDGSPGGGYDTTVAKVSGGQVALVNASVKGQNYVVTTYVVSSSYADSVHRWWLLLGGGSLALLLLSIGAAEIVTRRLVRPLVQTAETAHRLSAGDVDARAPASGPAEVAEVGVALNRLADRIGDLIAEERETVADLSHRLRTPLTALRLDVDNLTSRADAERLGAHVSALERSLTSVIRAARRPRSSALVAASDAAEVVRGRVAFWAPLAEDQGRRVEVDIAPGPLPVRAPAEDLAAAVDALLENVIAHTPEGSALAVRVTTAGHGADVQIVDEGPGIPATAAIRGRSDRGSTGLGLSIARRCAEAAGGELIIETGPSGQGAMVTVRLGAP